VCRPSDPFSHKPRPCFQGGKPLKGSRLGAAGAEAAVRVARARLREAAITHERTRLKAPRAGCVLRLHRRERESVSGTDQTPILVAADPRELAIRTAVDESQARPVREGLQASVSIPADEGIALAGTVRRISGTMGRKVIHSDDRLENVESRVLEVIVWLAAPGSLRINQPVNVSIHTVGTRCPAQPAAIVSRSTG
jgi:hypothetical protein